MGFADAMMMVNAMDTGIVKSNWELEVLNQIVNDQDNRGNRGMGRYC